MNYKSLIAAALIVMVLFHELKYWRMQKIKAAAKNSDRIIMLAAILFIAALAVYFAGHALHYLIACCAVLFIVADVEKQGLSEEGVQIVAKGKELYRWAELDHADIAVSDRVKVDYFTSTGAKVATQFFSADKYEEITAMFRENNLNVRTLEGGSTEQ